MKGKLGSILIAAALCSGVALAAGGTDKTDGATGTGTGTGMPGGTGTGTGTTGSGPAGSMTGGAVAGPEGQQNALEQFDRNRDGYLSRDEGTKVPGLGDQWAELDTDGDGRLDPAEFGHFNAPSMIKRQ